MIILLSDYGVDFKRWKTWLNCKMCRELILCRSKEDSERKCAMDSKLYVFSLFYIFSLDLYILLLYHKIITMCFFRKKNPFCLYFEVQTIWQHIHHCPEYIDFCLFGLLTPIHLLILTCVLLQGKLTYW